MMFDGFLCFFLSKLKETHQSTMWITNFLFHSFCKYRHEIMIFQWITFECVYISTSGADWWSSRLHMILLISSVLLLELFLSPSSCWYPFLLISLFTLHLVCIYSVWSSCWYFLDECLTCWVLFWPSVTGGFLSDVDHPH